MAKAKRTRRAKAKFDFDSIPPTEAQLANGDFERDFVTHVDTNTKAMTYKRKTASVVDKWIKEGAPGFDEDAQKFIAKCQFLWSRLGQPGLTACYGERLPASTHDEGWKRQEALDQLHFYKKVLGPKMEKFWDVFENVVRYDQPAGKAGSDFANNNPQAIQSAKIITGMVASFIASQVRA